MKHLRTAFKCIVAFLLLCTLINIIECGRGGGGRSSSGGSRSSSSGSRGSSSGSRGWSWGGWGGKSSSSSSSSSSSANRGSSGSSSGYGAGSAFSLTPTRISSSNTHSTSHVLPVSTGSRNTAQQSHITPQHATPLHSPSAPPMGGQQNAGGSHAPAIGWNTNNQPAQAPAPGWNVGNNANIRRDQTQGLNNAPYPNHPGGGMHPPPYSSQPNQPGAGMHPPPYSSHPGGNPPPYSSHPGGNPPPYSSHPGGNPPPYSSHPGGNPPPYSSHPGGNPPPYSSHPAGHPPPYSPHHTGGVNNYPGPPLSGVPPPPYPGTSYLSAGHYGGMGGHYPTQQGAPNYYQTPHHYPQPNNLPPPPPGYSPYGVPYYQKPSSGIKASHVMMGVALWQLTKPSHSYHFHGSGYDSYNNPGYGYHEFNRQRYTTTYGSQNSQSNAPGAHNTLEMTHYVVPDDKGTYKTVVGNMTCLSVYDAKEVSKWANRTTEDFYRKFPGSEFPLFETDKNSTNKFENFTMIPGRVIHEETVSVTCCGTDKGPLELSMLTSGKSPDVNCLHFIGKIPFRKLTFVKIQHVPVANVSMADWKPIELAEPNLNETSTPTPLAPYPNATESTSSTTPSVDLSQTFSPLGVNNSSNTTLDDLNIETVTFPSLGSINSTTPETNITFPSIESNNETLSSVIT